MEPCGAAYFDQDDPNVAVLRFDVSDGEFWDGPSGRLGSVVALLRAKLAGEERTPAASPAIRVPSRRPTVARQPSRLSSEGFSVPATDVRATRSGIVGAMETTVASLYVRLGRSEGIGAVVDGFYERVLADESLAPFFVRTTMSDQRRHLTAFVAAATGGPAYRGRSLRDSHKRLGIEQRHFDAVPATWWPSSTPTASTATSSTSGGAIAPLADEVVTEAQRP